MSQDQLQGFFFKYNGMMRQSNENHFSEVSQKTLFWTELEALWQLLFKTMQAYIRGSASTIATKLCGMIGENEQIKVHGAKFLKLHVQFGPICGPKLPRLKYQYLL